MRIIAIICIIMIIMAIALSGCRLGTLNAPPDMGGQQPSGDPDQGNGHGAEALPVAGKIVIITNDANNDEEEFLSAEALVSRYGEEQVAHMTWPGDGAEKYITEILQEVSEDPEVGALILNNSALGNRFVLSALANVRDDIFVVYAPSIYWGLPSDVDTDFRADLIIWTDMHRLGELYVSQAKAMGADTIVHYSFPRDLATPPYALRLDAMKAAAELEGIGFVELLTIDTLSDTYYDIVPTFITQDLPRQVGNLGVNTAFFGTEYQMQQPMVSQVIATGAIFVGTCFQSPYYVYPESFDIEKEIPTGEDDDWGFPIMRRIEVFELVQAIDEAVDAAGMAGRISGWVVPDRMLWTTIGFMYAVEWLNGNVPQERGAIDLDVLRRLAGECTAGLGVDAKVTLETVVQDGQATGRYIQGVVDYHVFGK